MKAILKKVFCLFWLLLFLQAALEVNACGIVNTFDDEYDTYLTTATVSVPNPVHYPIDLDFCFVCADVLVWNCISDLPTGCEVSLWTEKLKTSQPPPLNILHSVWII